MLDFIIFARVTVMLMDMPPACRCTLDYAGDVVVIAFLLNCLVCVPDLLVYVQRA